MPKITGRLMSEKLGTIQFLIFFLGFNLAFYPMHQLGIEGMPRRTYHYVQSPEWGLLNLIATIGVYLIALSITIFIFNFLSSIVMTGGKIADDDPWDGDTLEWATSSPPPPYNFATIPTVRSLEPVWDQPDLRDGAQPPEKGGRALAGGHLTLSTTLLDGQPRAIVPMPHATSWPL